MLNMFSSPNSLLLDALQGIKLISFTVSDQGYLTKTPTAKHM